MSETIFDYMPCDNCLEIRKVLELALELATAKSHLYLTIEHIIYGYMKFIEQFSTSRINYHIFPWYVKTSEYYENSNLSHSQTQEKAQKFCIDTDVVSFSKEYQNYHDYMDIESFYYLIIYMALHNNFKKTYLIPHNKINILNFAVPFEKFLRSGNSRLYLQKLYEDNATSKQERDVWRSFNTEYNQLLSEPQNKQSKISKTKANAIVPIVYSSEYSKPIDMEHITDVTHIAFKGTYSDIVGRTTELDRMITILSKKNKNNVTLIGEPGVGKTALVQGLAHKLVTKQVPPSLIDYHILELNVASTISGARYRGDFEQKLSNLFEDLQYNVKKIILFIDEIHTIIGLGSDERGNSLSLADMLKPLLLDSDLRIIGTSTFKEYKRLESDKALSRRFNTVTVNEPSFEQTLQILTKIKHQYEKYHGVIIPESTIKSAIDLSNQYIPEQNQPDKAIDVLDEACTLCINNSKNPKSTPMVSENDVQICISNIKNIPLSHIHNAYNLENLEEHLCSRVIGQDEAIRVVSKSIRRAQTGLNNENKPLASFLFLGPTGVGKTELSKALAEYLFHGKESFIRLDMSEYMEEHSVSKLIGSPPGYIGYQDSGQLTEMVRRHPYSLILFDEFEKAHPKVANILLQILDDGILTDSHGEHINFKNTIIILTSNVGQSVLNKNSIGFSESQVSHSKDISNEIKKHFKPEFLNRFDNIINFNQLSKEDIIEIAKLSITSDVIQKLNSRNVQIEISDEVITRIATLGYSQEYGAREVKRAIIRELKDPITDILLKDNNVQKMSIKLVNNVIHITPHSSKIFI